MQYFTVQMLDVTTVLLLIRFLINQSRVEKSNDNGNKPTANDVEAAVKASKQGVWKCVCVLYQRVDLYRLWVPGPCYYFLPLNN